MVITNPGPLMVFASQIYVFMLMTFTSINIILLSFLTEQWHWCYPFKKSCRCVFTTSLKITTDSIQLPLIYTAYPFVVYVNHN